MRDSAKEGRNRKAGTPAKVVIDGGITVTVIEVKGNQVRIGIDAPEDIRILRGELVGCWQDRPAKDHRRSARDLGDLPDAAPVLVG